MHSRFEELCALAATGQISGDAMQLLDQHVRECDRCRTFLQELSPLKAHVAPVLAASHARTCEAPEGMRERFLERAAAAGLNLRPGPMLGMPEPVAALPTAESTVRECFTGTWEHWCRWCASGFRVALPLAAASLCVLLGYFLALQRLGTSPLLTVSAVHVQPPMTRIATVWSTHLDHARTEAQQRIDQISAKLAQLQAEKQQLLGRLSEEARHASTEAQFEKRFKDTTQQLQGAESRLAKLRADLDAERQEQILNGAILIAQEQATQDANDRLAALQTQLERERETNAARTGAGDLIAERNLHIVDVYDTEASGERKRPFGRVFYVEDRSLVFYAYDLANAKHLKAKIAFHVWGETAGVKSAATYNLGILRADDPTTARWKLSFDDPKVLARINAVYITADPTTPTRSEPTSRKLLYAFLGSPNHP